MRRSTWKLAVILLMSSLAGCQSTGMSLNSCALHSVPNLESSSCMLPEWLAFSQQARVATPEWRRRVAERMTTSSPRSVMVRATMYAWDTNPARWREAQRMYSSVMPSLPRELVMLVQQWQHEIDLRLKLQQQSTPVAEPSHSSSSKAQRIDTLERQNAELQRKLDELAHIEAVMSGRPVGATR
ncbi:uncharacterized protein ZBT109_1759 [Zymobacter palmae]|uniref:Uncharacterized protein n=2 Tax=Zymobacter group TaxID=114403 RepID=A0A348HFV7_9GAMM|nr:uncharacterized protein ZBT109_1759 [Zymobacter palmae]